jgi:isochorismate pyruvate lyase
MTRPEDCTDMAELRGVIDGIDADLVALLARRQACIDRAIVLKQKENLPALIPDRVEEVIRKVRAGARDTGLDGDLAELLWRMLIDWAIAREAVELGEPGREA